MRPRHSMMAAAPLGEALPRAAERERAAAADLQRVEAMGAGALVRAPRPTASPCAWTSRPTQRIAVDAVWFVGAVRSVTVVYVNCCRWTAQLRVQAAARAIFASRVPGGVSPVADCSLIALKVERATVGCVGVRPTSTRAGNRVFRISKSHRAAIPVVPALVCRMARQRATAAPAALCVHPATLRRMAGASP